MFIYTSINLLEKNVKKWYQNVEIFYIILKILTKQYLENWDTLIQEGRVKIFAYPYPYPYTGFAEFCVSLFFGTLVTIVLFQNDPFPYGNISAIDNRPFFSARKSDQFQMFVILFTTFCFPQFSSLFKTEFHFE